MKPLGIGLRGCFCVLEYLKRAEKGHYMKVLLYKPKKYAFDIDVFQTILIVSNLFIISLSICSVT